jgi:hypothetical protein
MLTMLWDALCQVNVKRSATAVKKVQLGLVVPKLSFLVHAIQRMQAVIAFFVNQSISRKTREKKGETCEW